MELGFSLTFIFTGFFMFIISIYEELAEKTDELSKEKSDNAIIIMLFITCIMLVIGGISLLFASETYYSVTTDTIEEVLLSEYRPIGYGIVIFFFIPLLMLISKVFEALGYKEEGD